MIYFNSFKYKIKYKRLLDKIFQNVINEEKYNNKDFEVELNFIDKNKIKELNNKFRKVDKVTDVLSFPYFNKEDFNDFNKNKIQSFNFQTNKVMLGEIDICFDKLKEQALEYGHSKKREIGFLFLHAMLHLFGYDHIEESDRVIMREKEEKILKIIKLERK